MNFNQRIGGAFDAAGITQRLKQAAHERCLAGSEIAIEGHHHAGLEDAGELRAIGEGGGFVG